MRYLVPEQVWMLYERLREKVSMRNWSRDAILSSDQICHRSRRQDGEEYGKDSGQQHGEEAGKGSIDSRFRMTS